MAIALQVEDLPKEVLGEGIRPEVEERKTAFSFFGHFGLGNFGNESTLQAILCEVRRRRPDAGLSCICTGPAATATTHNIATLPASRVVVRAWKPRNRVMRVLRSAFIGIPSELYRWIEGLRILNRADALIIPGTGLITDAYGLGGWGPYTLFKWSLSAKMRGCKLLFVSVGAGPIYSRTGRWLAKSALALADFRSYRDNETKEYLSSIGAAVAGDKVYPDLAFSLAGQVRPRSAAPRGRRPVVGLGLMLYHRDLSGDSGPQSTYASYLEQLAVFVKWLLAKDYNIRLLIGELSDDPVVAEFKAILKDRLPAYDDDRIIHEPIRSVEDLLTQLNETDAVVATRFHNALLALVLNKPVISISFHQKCTSLMQDMGLQAYCQDIKQLSAEKLIEQFCQIEKNSIRLRNMIKEQVAARQMALDEQYGQIFKQILPS